MGMGTLNAIYKVPVSEIHNTTAGEWYFPINTNANNFTEIMVFISSANLMSWRGNPPA